MFANNPAKKRALVATLIMLLGVTYIDLGQRLLLELNGTIISSHEEPKWGNSPDVMVYTRYIIRQENGVDQEYVTDGSHPSLERSMKIGTVVHKKKWELGYQKNNEWVRYPYLSFVAIVILICALFPLYAALFKWDPPKFKRDSSKP